MIVKIVVFQLTNHSWLQVKEVHVQAGGSIGEDEVILEFYPEESEDQVNVSQN